MFVTGQMGLSQFFLTLLTAAISLSIALNKSDFEVSS